MNPRVEEVREALRAATARERGGCTWRIPACMGMAAREQCTCDPLPSDRWKRRVQVLLDECDQLRAENTRLQEENTRQLKKMPSDAELDAFAALVAPLTKPTDEFGAIKVLRPWLARLNAADGGAHG